LKQKHFFYIFNHKNNTIHKQVTHSTQTTYLTTLYHRNILTVTRYVSQIHTLTFYIYYEGFKSVSKFKKMKPEHAQTQNTGNIYTDTSTLHNILNTQHEHET